MNFRAFILLAEEHLLMNGWSSNGHNGTWLMFRKGGIFNQPIGAALIHELLVNNDFQPVVEEYLAAHGWKRTRNMVSGGIWPQYHCVVGDVDYKRLPAALMEQLKLHRIGHPTPTRVSTVHD